MKRWKALGMAGPLALVLAGALAVPTAFAGEDGRALVYRGGEQSYVVSGSTLFAQTESHLPGDALEGTVVIENESDMPCEVFTVIEDVVAKGPDDMLGRITYMVRTSDGETVYEGALEDAEGTAPVSLGVVGAGETMAAEYGVSIPAELTNEYADAAVGMSMVVSMSEREDGSSIGLVQTGGGDLNGGSAGAGGGAGIVKAGDTLPVLPLVLGAIVAAGTVIWCAWKRRKRMW